METGRRGLPAEGSAWARAGGPVCGQQREAEEGGPGQQRKGRPEAFPTPMRSGGGDPGGKPCGGVPPPALFPSYKGLRGPPFQRAALLGRGEPGS